LSPPKIPFLGDLFYTTPFLFQEDREMPLNRALNGIRRAGKQSIEDIYPNLKIGMLAGIHLNNSYLHFSPHVHVIMSNFAISDDYTKSQIDSKNIHKAWRSPIKRGKLKKVKSQLLERWAENYSDYCYELFKNYKNNFKFCRTSNPGYQRLRKMSERDLKELQDTIKQAVLSDKHCIEVKKLDKDLTTGDDSPSIAYRNGLMYCYAPPLKHNRFVEAGEGYTLMAIGKDGKLDRIGDWPIIQERHMKILSPKHLKRYQPSGLFHNSNTEIHNRFIDIVDSLGQTEGAKRPPAKPVENYRRGSED
jgi:hypothetical protein